MRARGAGPGHWPRGCRLVFLLIIYPVRFYSVAVATIIIPVHLAGYLTGKEIPLPSSPLRVQVSSSNTETLALHQTLYADLIVANLVDPLLTGEMLCLQVRVNKTLRRVAILLICNDTAQERQRAASCLANKILTLPVDPGLLRENIAQLLSIAERKSCRVLVQANTEENPNQEAFFGISHNLSATGLLLETEKSVPLHEHLHFVFYLPNSRQVHTEGDIVRATTMPDGAHHYGIKFVKLDPETRQAIEEFVRLSKPAGS